MATETDVIIAKFEGDISDLKAKLSELEKAYGKLGDTEKKTTDTQVKASADLTTAAQKRKAALVAEEAELKRLQTALKGAFSVPEITKFNSEINKTKNNISVLKGEATGLGKSVQGIGSQFASLGAGIAAAFSVQAVIAFGNASVDAFLEAEQNSSRLKNSLNEVGDAGEKAFERLIKQSQELATAGRSIFTDDDIQRAQTALANFGLTADQIEKTIPGLADFASVLKINIVDAAEKVGAGLQGAGGEFKKFGIDVSANKTELENLNIITDGFVKFQGRAAKETETLVGQLKDQERTIDELQETLGSKLAPAYVAVKRAVLEFGIAIFNSFSATGELENSLNSLGVTTTQQAKIIAAGFETIGQSEETVNQIRNLQNLTKTVEFYVDGVKAGTISAVDYYKALKNLNQLVTLQNTGTKEGQIAQKLLKNGISELTDTYERFSPALKKAIDLTKLSVDELNKLLKANEGLSDLTSKDTVAKINRELAARLKATEAAKKAEIELQKTLQERQKITDEITLQAEKNKLRSDELLNKTFEDQQKKNTAAVDKAVDDQVELNLAGNKELAQAYRDDVANKAQAEKDKLELNKQLQAATIQVANDIADSVFAIRSNDLKRQQDQETQALSDSKDKALSSKRLTDSERQRLNEEFAAKELALQKKQFEQVKKESTLEAIIKGALAVINALASGVPPYNYILAAGVGVATAAEIAVIQAQKFAKGKREKQKGGFAYVGEQGMETMYVPDSALIVDARKTKQHKALINAMMDGNLEKLLEDNYILPRLQKQKQKFDQQKEKSFANNVAKAVYFQEGWNLRDAKKLRDMGMPISNVDELAETIARKISSGYNPRRSV